MFGVKEIKSILREYNIRPSKRLGQNFLIDQNIQNKIIDAIKVDRKDIVLEIGPGLGAITDELCRRAKRVIAIEKDRRLYNFLLQNNPFTNLELIHGDILDYNFRAFRSRPCDYRKHDAQRLKVIGNLPYYISSPILINLLNNRSFIDTIFITVQKEFAERLIAKAGNKAYGSISCFIQFYAEPMILFTIKRTAFYPRPDVDSSFLKIRVRDKELYLTDEEKMFKIIKACFGKRRKTILNSLLSSGELGSKEGILNRLKIAGISPTCRPETVTLQEFAKLLNFTL